MREQVTAADCQSCGACCWAPRDDGDGIASVEPPEAATMGRRVVRLHVVEQHGHAMTRSVWKQQRSGPVAGREALVCSALRGSLMSRVSCGVYDVRPQVCRGYQPGSRRCLEARRALREAA